MTHLDFFKKLKRLTPLDPTTSILAFFFVSVCFILCFIYLDYRAVTTEFRSRVDPPSLIEWSGINGSLDENRRPRFLEEGGGDGCDVFDGEWVWDDSYPLYKSEDCLFLDNGFRCSENGRPDSFYTKWRWQPKNCDLPSKEKEATSTISITLFCDFETEIDFDPHPHLQPSPSSATSKQRSTSTLTHPRLRPSPSSSTLTLVCDFETEIDFDPHSPSSSTSTQRFDPRLRLRPRYRLRPSASTSTQRSDHPPLRLDFDPRHQRFDAKNMLEKLRNRRLVFVGDSIGRNQWESLLCMLSSAVPDKTSIFEVNGSPITKHTGFLAFKFRDFNCTVEYYRAPFLVAQGRAPARAPEKVKTTLRLDRLDWSSLKWKGADVLVFNTGHWWNYEKTMRGGCYFQEGEKVKMEMSVESALRRAIETMVDWIGSEVNFSKTQVIFRSYAPVHFRSGNWKTGGNCHRETLPDLGSLPVSPQTWGHFKTVIDVLTEHSNKSQVKKIDFLNVTYMTSRRKDGHLSLYYLGPKIGLAPLHRQDCSHWCLPGVPDSWNELLYANFLKWEHNHISYAHH